VNVLDMALSIWMRQRIREGFRRAREARVVLAGRQPTWTERGVWLRRTRATLAYDAPEEQWVVCDLSAEQVMGTGATPEQALDEAIRQEREGRDAEKR
jgi:hypothetical protein